MERWKLIKLGKDNYIRKCEICGSCEKVFHFRRKRYLCERHYAQMARKEKRDIREAITVPNLKNEIWKDINGYEGLYQVSNLGRIKSLPKFHQGERILKERIDRYGYLYIGFFKNKVKKYYKIHRLVAEAFIPNPKELPCVNHKDENKTNNNVENLEWCSVAYNNSYATRLERVAAKHRGKKLTAETKKKISIALKKGRKNHEL